ncbi:putative phospholipase [Helianthus annuus]|nr:putative phospholipase [Helianthus annuus]
MVKRKKDASNSYPPTKEELYYAEVQIKYHIAVATVIRARLGPHLLRSELFRGTCFGHWLDVQSTSTDSALVHLMLQTEYTPTPVMHQNTLFFRVGGQELRFGPQEFCLITGMRFGPHHWEYGRADSTFRERVFGHAGRPKVRELKNVFHHYLDELSDLDAVRICLLMMVEVGFMAKNTCLMVDLILLELVEDLDSWNTFPWGSYVWNCLYKRLHNAVAKRSARGRYTPTFYTLSGFIWAFKIWIFEVFPYAKTFAIKHDGIPRAIGWGKNKCISWKLALTFVTKATVPGFEPLPVLTPTPEECATDWWRASCQFFDNYANDFSPLLKNPRLSSPPQPSVMVRDQLAEDIADPTTGHQSTGSRTNMERVDELLKARRPHSQKTEMPTTSDLFGPSDHAETINEGKVSCQSDMICVQGYNVKQSVAPILESIFKKHGDIAADCLFKPASMRSSFLEIVCEAVSRIQTNDRIHKIEEIEQQVLVAEAANINVSWLRVHLDTIRANRKCCLLMEMKANTSLVKKAALMDLRESCVELMAAQERFEKAEKCVRVLNLVENNLNDNILESKGGIYSWARQLDL